MQNILQLIGEQTNFLKQKGYSNKDLHFEGLPDTTYTQLFNQFSEGIIKTWPKNSAFEFSIDHSGKYTELNGIAHFKFTYQYHPYKYEVKLTSMKLMFHTKSIEIKLLSPHDLPHSSEIPSLLNDSKKHLHRKYNITRKETVGHFTHAPKL